MKTQSPARSTAKLELRAVLYPLEAEQQREIVLSCQTRQEGLELMREMASHMSPDARWDYVGVIEEKRNGEWRQVLFDQEEGVPTQANAWRVLGNERKWGSRGVKRVPIRTPRVFIERVFANDDALEAEGWVAGCPFYFSLKDGKFAFSVARDPEADPRRVGNGSVDGFQTVQPFFGLQASRSTSGDSRSHQKGTASKCHCMWCQLSTAADLVRACCAAFLLD